MNRIKLTFSSSTALTAVVSSTSWVGYIAVYKLYQLIIHKITKPAISTKQSCCCVLQCEKLLDSLYLRHLTVKITIVIYWNAERAISSSSTQTKTNSCVDNRLAYKSSSNIFPSAKRKRQIFYVLGGKSERESGSSTFARGQLPEPEMRREGL